MFRVRCISLPIMMSLTTPSLRRGILRDAHRVSLLVACLSLLLGLFVSESRAQVSIWTSHTSMREVMALAVSPDAIWAATTGGVFSYLPETGEVKRYTITDGLYGISARAIAFDPDCSDEGCVWIGYAGGIIDQLDVSAGTVRTYYDIARAERFPSREINRIVVHGDTVLVATSFGIVLFDSEKQEVRDSYDQLGTVTPGTDVYDVVVGRAPNGGAALWAATSQGVAYASLSSSNLKDPNSWVVERGGLPSDEIRSLEFKGDRLYVGTMSGLAVRNPDGSYSGFSSINQAVYDLSESGDNVFGVDPFGIVVLTADGRQYVLRAGEFGSPTAVMPGGEGEVWIADRMEGIVRAEWSTNPARLNVLERFYPPGPYHSLFERLAVDSEGNLWAAGTYGSGLGFYRMSPTYEWTNFIAREYAELNNKSAFTRISVGEGGWSWAASEGNGLAEVSPDGKVVVYDRTNSTLRRAEGTQNENFILVGGAAMDAEGRLWVTNTDGANPLHVRLENGEWVALSFPECNQVNSFTGTFKEIMIDEFGQKWIIVVNKRSLNSRIGFLVLDTGNTPTDQDDDECRFFGEVGGLKGQGLPSVEVTDVVEDRSGMIWIGTGNGVAYMPNSSIMASDRVVQPTWPIYADRSLGSFMFEGLDVNDLAVDPANRIWIASEEGAYLIQAAAGGFEIVYHFTAQNSPLFSNTVMAVEVNDKTGEVFFSTDRGLVSFAGDAIAPSETVRDLFIFPNPVRVADGETPNITIDGLVEQTEVLILAAHGEVVRRFDARGGRSQWDGRDSTGELVPSGMYLVVAVGQNGERTAYGKVAIIR